MNDVEQRASVRRIVARAVQFAQIRADPTVTPTHLLLAVMEDTRSLWARRIVERGGFSFNLALRRLRWPEVAAIVPISPEARLYRASVRLMLIIVITGPVIALWRRLTIEAHPLERPRLDRSAADVLRALSEWPSKSDSHSVLDSDVGRLLLTLATTPGRHLRLLDNANVLACAVRRDLGLDRWHHRMILRFDWPKLVTRRTRMWLRRQVFVHGWISIYGLALVGSLGLGLAAAVLVFAATVPATLVLYLFLWPSLILITGIRTGVCRLVGCDTRVHRWYEIPGGEIALAGDGEPIVPSRLMAAIIVPRAAAFMLCISALVFVGWRSQRLGVALFPTLFVRPDLLLSVHADSFILAPFAVFFDAMSQDGVLKGIGLLAGLGAGMLSLPTYRELTLLRLHAGHERGRGSRLARAATLPASVLAGAFACVEAVLPLRNGPIYLTVFVVPLGVALVIAALISMLLPY
jgi:hypothetical protein